MLRIIAVMLIVCGIYIGMQYKEPLTDWLGQDTLDNAEQRAADLLSQGGDLIVEQLEEIKE